MCDRIRLAIADKLGSSSASDHRPLTGTPHAAAEKTPTTGAPRTMFCTMFRRFFQRLVVDPEAAEAIEALSPLAQTMVRLDRKHEAAWGRLFADVGRDEAIELTEVTGADSWARMRPEAIAAVLRRWATGELDEGGAIEELNRIEQTARTVLADAEERISEHPMHEESRVVLWAACNLYDHLFPAANAYVKNEPADKLAGMAQGAKDRLEDESEQFDRATGRLSMPLIGDPRHWDR
jgi:hypothetical protein